MGFGNSVTRTVIYEAQKRHDENKAIWSREQQKETRKHESAKMKLEDYKNRGKTPTEKQMERINTDLNYQAKTPDEVRQEQKTKEMSAKASYIESVGKTKYVCSQLFGNWVLYVGMNKKK